MIKLDLPAKPAQLTSEFQTEQTQRYKASGNSVWNKPWLKQAISEMAFGKCCYSEIRLGEESKYMEVEHFHPKSRYPDQVMEWGNLLPACKKCNTTKGEHDTRLAPIVNPFIDDPKDYFYFKASQYKAKDNQGKGERTIITLALNDRAHFVMPRYRVETAIKENLNDRKIDLDKIRDRSIPIGRIKRLLDQGNRKEEYSAFVSTTILSDTNFQAIETFLRSQDLWDAELDVLKAELEFCALME